MPSRDAGQVDAVHAHCPFEVQSFTPARWGPAEEEYLGFGRAVLKKRFAGGDLEATSTVEMMFWRPEATVGVYLALELVEGMLAGRSGTFVLQHGGTTGPNGEHTWVEVVNGAATGELTGLRGGGRLEHGLLELDLDFG
jgi:hypothetical protein